MTAMLAPLQQDILHAALIFGIAVPTIKIAEFAKFVRAGGITLEDEQIDDCLADLAERGALRQIGPGVYARPARTVSLEEPLWPEDAPPVDVIMESPPCTHFRATRGRRGLTADEMHELVGFAPRGDAE